MLASKEEGARARRNAIDHTTPLPREPIGPAPSCICSRVVSGGMERRSTIQRAVSHAGKTTMMIYKPPSDVALANEEIKEYLR